MDTLQKQYCELCTELFFPLGFQRSKKKNNYNTIAYCRVINDLFQSFELEKIRRFVSISSYRIGFSVIPLCMDIRKYEYIITEGTGYGSNYLKELGDPKKYSDSWEVNVLEKDSIHEALCEMRTLFAKRLIPFFKEAVSYDSAFNAITNNELIKEANRLAYLHDYSKENLCKDYSFLYYDEVRALLALKCRNYLYAKDYYSWHLELEARKLKEFEELVKNDSASSRKLTERREHVQKIREMKERVDAEDIEFIEKQLNENEEYTKAILMKYNIPF